MSIRAYPVVPTSFSPRETYDTPFNYPAIEQFIHSLKSSHSEKNPYYVLSQKILEDNEKKTLEERIALSIQVVEAVAAPLASLGTYTKEKALFNLRQTFYEALIEKEACHYRENFDRGGHPRSYLNQFQKVEPLLRKLAPAGSFGSAPSEQLVAYAFCENQDDLRHPLAMCREREIVSAMDHLYGAYTMVRKRIEESKAADGALAFLKELKKRWQRLVAAYSLVGSCRLRAHVERDGPIPFELAKERETKENSPRVSYIDWIWERSKSDAAKWFTGLPRGIQYRLYHNICDQKMGVSEECLLALHQKRAPFIYASLFPESRYPRRQEELTPEFIRSELFTRYVQRRRESYSREDREILKAIEHFTIVYHVADNPKVLMAHMGKMDPKIFKFLVEDSSFLSYIHSQALAVRAVAPACDSSADEARSWAREHFLDDPHIFYEAITRWYDVLLFAHSEES